MHLFYIRIFIFYIFYMFLKSGVHFQEDGCCIYSNGTGRFVYTVTVQGVLYIQ